MVTMLGSNSDHDPWGEAIANAVSDGDGLIEKLSLDDKTGLPQLYRDERCVKCDGLVIKDQLYEEWRCINCGRQYMVLNQATPNRAPDTMRYRYNDQRAEQWFVNIRWPNGITCTKCGSVDISDYRPSNKTAPFNCRACNSGFSVKLDTIMHNSKLTYGQWLAVFRLYFESKSEKEIVRLAGIGPTTCRRAMNKIGRLQNTGRDQIVNGVIAKTKEIGFSWTQVETSLPSVVVAPENKPLSMAEIRERANQRTGSGQATEVPPREPQRETSGVVIEAPRKEPEIEPHEEMGELPSGFTFEPDVGQKQEIAPEPETVPQHEITPEPVAEPEPEPEAVVKQEPTPEPVMEQEAEVLETEREDKQTVVVHEDGEVTTLPGIVYEVTDGASDGTENVSATAEKGDPHEGFIGVIEQSIVRLEEEKAIIDKKIEAYKLVLEDLYGEFVK